MRLKLTLMGARPRCRLQLLTRALKMQHRTTGAMVPYETGRQWRGAGGASPFSGSDLKGSPTARGTGRFGGRAPLHAVALATRGTAGRPRGPGGTVAPGRATSTEPAASAALGSVASPGSDRAWLVDEPLDGAPGGRIDLSAFWGALRPGARATLVAVHGPLATRNPNAMPVNGMRPPSPIGVATAGRRSKKGTPGAPLDGVFR